MIQEEEYELMPTLEHLQNKRLEYDILMKQVLDGVIHCKKEGEEVTYPLSNLQKFKNNCLYKYYEYQYNKYDKLVYEEIMSDDNHTREGER